MSAIEKYSDRLIQQAYEQGKHDLAARVIDAIEGAKDTVRTDDFDNGYVHGLEFAIFIIQRLEREE